MISFSSIYDSNVNKIFTVRVLLNVNAILSVRSVLEDISETIVALVTEKGNSTIKYRISF